MKKHTARFWRSNSGSATITVVVSMLMVIAVGAGLLFAAYTSYKIALAQREDIKAFYTAEAAMDDIRAGVQERVSAALTEAYTLTLTQYAQSDDSSFDPQMKFSWNFIDALCQADALILANGAAYNYNAELLGGYIAIPAESSGNAEVSAGGGAELTTADGSCTRLTLRRVGLTWTENGIESNLVTDIAVNVPSFSGRLGEFAIAAEGGIVQRGGKSTVTGSVYSGADIEINSGSLSLEGKIFVADDLLLDGAGSVATLSGEYYGFGSSRSNPSKSSAILINGKNSTLNLNGLERLSLAGRSFISVVPESATVYNDIDEQIKSNDITMGQSVAFKANQLAYLAPVECLTNYASNPCELRRLSDSGEYEAITADNKVVLWDDKTIEYYGGRLQTMYKSFSAETDIKIGYLFIIFDDPNDANRYFKDYFQEHPDWITQYKDFYIADYNAYAGSIVSDGNAFAGSADDLQLVQARAGADIMGHRFSDFVNVEAVRGLNGEVLEFKEGNVTIIVAGRDYTLTEDCNGLVITAGKLTLSPSADITAALLQDSILSARSTDGGHVLSDFLKPGFGDEEPSAENAWASDKLVIYENWTKN